MKPDYRWQVACREDEHEDYLRFVLNHYRDLQAPFDFFTFLAGAYLSAMDGRVFVYRDGCGDIAGAAAYTWGTSDLDYADKENVEIQIAFLCEEHRVTKAFVCGIELMTDTVIQTDKSVRYLKFYAPALPRFRRLFGKVASLERSGQQLDYYTADVYTLNQLAKWCV